MLFLQDAFSSVRQNLSMALGKVTLFIPQNDGAGVGSLLCVSLWFLTLCLLKYDSRHFSYHVINYCYNSLQ